MKKSISKNLRITKFAKKEEIPQKWYIIDAENKVLGRLASEIAKRIRGKHNPKFTPNTDTGDWIIVINAEKVKLTGKRADLKEYITHSGYPGGQKVRTFNEMIKKHPEKVIELAVGRMLPKTILGRKLKHKLKVYCGTNHPHNAQKPEVLNI